MNQFDKTVTAVRRAMPQKPAATVRRWLGGAEATRAQLRAIQSTARRLLAVRAANGEFFGDES